MAGRRSKISRLPAEIRELIGKLRTERGCTIDEIHEKLTELNIPSTLKIFPDEGHTPVSMDGDVVMDLLETLRPQPEEIENYEGGLKGSLLDGRVSLEATVFRMTEDGVVLIDQSRCRGYRKCVEGCPYKKAMYRPTTRTTEKCIACFPRLEGKDKEISPTGAPAETRCMSACVGKIRLQGLVTVDEDGKPHPAGSPDAWPSICFFSSFSAQ